MPKCRPVKKRLAINYLKLVFINIQRGNQEKMNTNDEELVLNAKQAKGDRLQHLLI